MCAFIQPLHHVQSVDSIYYKSNPYAKHNSRADWAL